MKDKLTVDVVKDALIFSACLGLCYVTKSNFLVVVAAVGAFSALARKVPTAIKCWLFLTFAVIINPIIVPKSSFLIVCILRFGAMSIALLLILSTFSMSRGKVLPLGFLFFYLIEQVVSSMNGMVPPVSFMKLIQFSAFLFSLWQGTRCLARNYEDTYKLRTFFLGAVVVVGLGSLLVLPFPTIAYTTTLQWEALEKGSAAAMEMYMNMKDAGSMVLFSGITQHSQTLAPLSAMMLIYVLSDMLFVEKKIKLLHAILSIALMVIAYMTRSRTALLAIVSGISFMVLYTVRQVRIEQRDLKKIKTIFFIFITMSIVGGTFFELKDHTFTRWIRKTENVYDDRSLNEAVTSTRQGKIEQCLYEYHLNPMFGIGFQVDENVKKMYQRSNGLMLSAPIEKGLLPLMVLGEGGIVGLIIFGLFVIAFYVGCSRDKFYISATLFFVMFMSNIGEATFFSPGSTGGILWVFVAVGGYALDQLVFVRVNKVTND